MKIRKYWLVCLALLILMAPVYAARAESTAKEKRGTLCGQLAFMTEQRTGQRLLGLIPCGSSQPIIFTARPGKLYNYYRFKDVTLTKGDRIRTLEYGPLETFIEGFDSFVEIADCRSCQEKAPTRTPIPRLASQNCGEYLIQNGQGEFFPEFGDQAWVSSTVKIWEQYAASTELYQSCGSDAACQAEAVMLRVGESLGARVERSPEQRDRFIAFLSLQMTKQETLAACPNFAWLIRFLTAGLSRQGFAIDTLAVSSPATAIVTDRLGRQAGLLATGAIVSEIPNSRTVVTSQNKVILLPGGMFSDPVSAEMVTTWTAEGSADVEAAVNRNGEIWLASFQDTAYAPGGWAKLDLAGEPPWLILTAPDGSSTTLPSSAFTKWSVNENWLASPTPWQTETPWLPTEISTTAATAVVAAPATAAPSAAPTQNFSAPPPTAAPIEQPASPGACPLSAILFALPVAVLWRRDHKKR